MQEKNNKTQYPITDPVKLGAKLKELCDVQNISTIELRDYLHMGSTQGIYLWFSGQRLPNVDNLRALCRYLGERVDDLIDSERMEQANQILSNDLLPPHGKRILLYWMRMQKK